jgi:hypothetical protein
MKIYGKSGYVFLEKCKDCEKLPFFGKISTDFYDYYKNDEV